MEKEWAPSLGEKVQIQGKFEVSQLEKDSDTIRVSGWAKIFVKKPGDMLPTAIPIYITRIPIDFIAPTDEDAVNGGE